MVVVVSVVVAVVDVLGVVVVCVADVAAVVVEVPAVFVVGVLAIAVAVVLEWAQVMSDALPPGDEEVGAFIVVVDHAVVREASLLAGDESDMEVAAVAEAALLAWDVPEAGMLAVVAEGAAEVTVVVVV